MERSCRSDDFVKVCAGCGKVRDEHGRWKQSEAAAAERPGTLLSHALCLECAHRLYPAYYQNKHEPVR